MRTIFATGPPPLHPGETILGSADIQDLMTQWVVAEAGDVPTSEPDAVALAMGDDFTPHNRAPRARTRRRHDGRLHKVRR
jgi:hypothetical protein